MFGSIETICAENSHQRQQKVNGKTSNIAQKAAQEAKAASDAQNIAGQQAAHQVLINSHSIPSSLNFIPFPNYFCGLGLEFEYINISK